MKLKFRGLFNGDFSKLPMREEVNAKQFKEISANKAFAILGLSGGLSVVAMIFPYFLWRVDGNFQNGIWLLDAYFYHLPAIMAFFVLIAIILFSMFLHEFLHAICFKGDVELYLYLKKGAAFVIGTELMSKKRFIFSTMLPNILLGFIPLGLGLILPSNMLFLFGAISAGGGFGDYYNVYNAITQVPPKAKIYMSQEKTFWTKG